MAIADLDGYLGGYKQAIPYIKTGTLTVVAGIPFCPLNVAGIPAAKGDLNPGNTAAGVVPTDATAGFPAIQNRADSGHKLYLSRISGFSANPGSFALFDVVFWAGMTTIPTSGTTTVTLTGQPSFASRVPFKSDGTTPDYSGVQPYVLMSVAGSNHAHSVSITYEDQDGNSAVANGVNVSTQNMIVGRLLPIPLAAGDCGVSKLATYLVNGVTSATGSVSILLMRKLWQGRLGYANDFGPDQVGLVEVFEDSALLLVPIMDSTALIPTGGSVSLMLELVEG